MLHQENAVLKITRNPSRSFNQKIHLSFETWVKITRFLVIVLESFSLSWELGVVGGRSKYNPTATLLMIYSDLFLEY